MGASAGKSTEIPKPLSEDEKKSQESLEYVHLHSKFDSELFSRFYHGLLKTHFPIAEDLEPLDKWQQKFDPAELKKNEKLKGKSVYVILALAKSGPEAHPAHGGAAVDPAGYNPDATHPAAVAGEKKGDVRAIAGGICFEFYPKSGAALVNHIVVDPRFRRQGVAKGLMRNATQILTTKKGGKKLTVVYAETYAKGVEDTVFKSDDRHAVLQKLGFGQISGQYIQPPRHLEGEPSYQMLLLQYKYSPKAAPPTKDGKTPVAHAPLREFIDEYSSHAVLGMAAKDSKKAAWLAKPWRRRLLNEWVQPSLVISYDGPWAGPGKAPEGEKFRESKIAVAGAKPSDEKGAVAATKAPQTEEEKLKEAKEQKEFEDNLEKVNLRTHYDEHLLTRFYKGLMKTNFPIEDELEPLDVWIEKLDPEKRSKLNAKNYILTVYLAMIKGSEDPTVTAEDGKKVDKRVIAGGICFEYYKKSSCALITYFVVDPKYRQRGVVKILVADAQKILDTLAADHKSAVKLIFAETNARGVEDGVMPSEVRHKIMQRLNFGHLDFQYVQPPLDEGLDPCYDLLLIALLQSPAIKKEAGKEGKQRVYVETEDVVEWLKEFAHSCHGFDTDEADFVNLPYYTHMFGKLKDVKTIAISGELPWAKASPPPEGEKKKDHKDHGAEKAGKPAAPGEKRPEKQAEKPLTDEEKAAKEQKEFEQNLDFVNLRTHYDEALLTKFYKGLMKTNFPIEDELEPLDVWVGKLDPAKRESAHPKNYILTVLLAMIKGTVDGSDTTPEGKKTDNRIISGGICFEYYKESGCALITYFVVDPRYRRQGVVKILVNSAIQILNDIAKNHNNTVKLIFAETNAKGVEDGVMPSEVRHKIMQRLNFGHLDFQYVQPPLDEGLDPCYSLLLIALLQSPAIKKEKGADGKDRAYVETETVVGWLKEFAHSCHGFETPEDEFNTLPYYTHMFGKLKDVKTITISGELPWAGPGSPPEGEKVKEHKAEHKDAPEEAREKPLTEEEKAAKEQKEFEASLDFVNLRTHYDETLLTKFYKGLMKTNFPIEDELEPLDVWIEKLDPEKRSKLNPKSYILTVLLAMIKGSAPEGASDKTDERTIAGGICFEYYKESGCALITYFVVDPRYRKQGVVKILVRDALKILDSVAKDHDNKVKLVFAETNAKGVEDGVMPSEVRHKIMQRLNFGHLDFQYVQPPLDEGLDPCYSLLLIALLQSPEVKKETGADGKARSFVETSTVVGFLKEFAHSCHGFDTPEEEFVSLPYYRHMFGKLKDVATITISGELPWAGPGSPPEDEKLKEHKETETKTEEKHALRIIIAGPPAAGKGTQCAYIKEKYGVVHISTGDALREAVKAGTDLGKEAQTYMSSGQLVPDALIIGLVKEKLATDEVKSKGWLLDGFPRTKEQAAALEKEGIHPDLFILIEVPDDALVERVEGRRLDPVTGEIYHLKFRPPPQDDEIIARLTQRSDDNADKLKTRLVEYHSHVAAVRGYYESALFAVDGAQDKETISKALSDRIDKV